MTACSGLLSVSETGFCVLKNATLHQFAWGTSTNKLHTIRGETFLRWLVDLATCLLGTSCVLCVRVHRVGSTTHAPLSRSLSTSVLLENDPPGFHTEEFNTLSREEKCHFYVQQLKRLCWFIMCVMLHLKHLPYFLPSITWEVINCVPLENLIFSGTDFNLTLVRLLKTRPLKQMRQMQNKRKWLNKFLWIIHTQHKECVTK